VEATSLDRPLWAVLIVSVLALTAGCLGTADDPSLETNEDASDEAAASDDGTDANLAPASVERGIDWEGNLGTAACVPTGPGACMAFGTAADRFHVVETDGEPTGIEVTLDWEPESPLTAELRFTLNTVSSCGDGCTLYEPLATVEGGAPLTLDRESIAGTGNLTLGLTVEDNLDTPWPVNAGAHHDQSFRAEGEVTVQPSKTES